MKNAISVDVEEYYHAANLDAVAGPAKWHTLPKRTKASTEQILEIFDRRGIRATFFILGCVATKHPELVRVIANAGHEIASHGYAHRIAYEQTPRQFARDVRRAKLLLEDLSGSEVVGYRAPSFSITDQNPWAYDALIASGYRYDSSLYPVKHPRYGNSAKSLFPFFLKRDVGQLLILPLAVSPVRLFGRDLRLPVAGGAYWRIFPRPYLRWALKRINAMSSHPFICYFHPWELDPGQPYYRELPFLTKVRHYTGLSRFPETIEYFLKHFEFDSIRGCYVTTEFAETKIET